MRKLIIVFLFLSFFTRGFSQKTISDYSYVVVPEQFEFLNQKDKYQLNSISRFLFNKHGFHAFFSNEAPNAKRCDGLYADVERGKSFFKTKFTIVLKDCNGAEVYRSPEGVSKYKEFNKAYQDALRRAFKNIEALNVQQKEVVLFDAEAVSEKPAEEEQMVEKEMVVKEAAAVSTGKVEKESAKTSEKAIKPTLPESKFSNYSYNGKTFLLRKTSEGYSLYEETTTTDAGLLLVGKIEVMNSSKLFFTDASENIFKASFDASQNLIIQKKDGAVVYKIVH